MVVLPALLIFQEYFAMSLLSKSRAVFAILFFTAIFCGGAWNIYSQGPRVLDGLSRTGLPRSVQDVRDACSLLQSLVNENLEGRYVAFAAYAAMQHALGKHEMNDFSVIKAGRLYRGGIPPLDTENARTLAEDVAEFAEAAGETGASVLYLNSPDTVIMGSEGTKHLPSHMPYRDYNVAADAFLYALREKGVQYLDTRYSFFEYGVPPESISPRTSFLLSGDAGFAVFTYLLEALEQKFDISLDPSGQYRNRGNYAIIRYPAFFMGELGKETGPAFSGLDDFTSFSPDFDTEFVYDSLDMFGTESRVEGSAEETLLNPDALIYYENLYRLYPQSFYRHTNATWTRVLNPRNPAGPKLLVIHDYYTAQVISHLAPLCGELHTLAYQENLPMSALEYIQGKDFDLVLVSFMPQNLVNPKMQALVRGDAGKR